MKVDEHLSEQLDSLREMPALSPDEVTADRTNFLQEATRLRKSLVPAKPTLWQQIQAFFTLPQTPVFKLAPILATVVLFMGVACSGVAYASQDALPHELLYPVKRTVENTQLAFTVNAGKNADLHAEFATNRVEELQAMLEAGQEFDKSELVKNFNDHATAINLFLDNEESPDQSNKRQELLAKMATQSQHLEVLTEELDIDVEPIEFVSPPLPTEENDTEQPIIEEDSIDDEGEATEDADTDDKNQEEDTGESVNEDSEDNSDTNDEDELDESEDDELSIEDDEFHESGETEDEDELDNIENEEDFDEIEEDTVGDGEDEENLESEGEIENESDEIDNEDDADVAEEDDPVDNRDDELEDESEELEDEVNLSEEDDMGEWEEDIENENNLDEGDEENESDPLNEDVEDFIDENESETFETWDELDE